MTNENYFAGMIIDNTEGATADSWTNKAIRAAIGTNGEGKLSHELADLFVTKTIEVDSETRVVVEWL